MMERITTLYPAGTLILDVNSGLSKPVNLIGFAARVNAKRAFLFMSKVLGKHYPARPSRMHEVHQQLAQQLNDLKGPVVFIGMAETATGLGQGVYEEWLSINPSELAMYIHTTRYQVPNAERVVFHESHSHAPNVFLNIPIDPALKSIYESATSVVLIDDELSTGNTFVNLVNVLRMTMTRLTKVHISTIADFMGADCRSDLEVKMGMQCIVQSLLQGQWSYSGESAPIVGESAQNGIGSEVMLMDSGYGRIGRSGPVRIDPELIRLLAHRYQQGKTLVLGTGEFMHGAFALGLALEKHGCDVHIQATTRSPILEWGAIEAKISVPDAYGEGIANYLYNVRPGQYQRILVCHEVGASNAVDLGHALLGSLIRFEKEDHVQENPLH